MAAMSSSAPSSTPLERMSTVTCRGLVKRYGGVAAVDGIDLEIRRGECFGLLGPNGAGKTTTVEMLEGLRRPDAGEILILGMHWDDSGSAIRERLGVQLQETQLPEKLSVIEILRLFRSFYHNGRDPREVLEIVALEEKKRTWVAKLSGGQRQRLALGCALIGEPEVLFLDEPTTGLDPQARRKLWEVVERFKSQGRTVLLTTHYMEEAEKLCDRIAIVDHGKIIALGSPLELIASLGGRDVVEFSVEDGGRLPTAESIRGIPGIRSVQVRGGEVALSVEKVHTVVPRLLAALDASGAKLSRLTTHHATLEDVFVHLTGRHLRDA